MIQATSLQIHNFIGCKVSNDSGIYQVEGIDGWKRIFKSKEDERIYNKPMDLDKYNPKEKQSEYHDERLIRISGGARNGEQYLESQLRGIRLTGEWLIKSGCKKTSDEEHIYAEYELRHEKYFFLFREEKNIFWHNQTPLKFVHTWQNLFFANTLEKLTINY